MNTPLPTIILLVVLSVVILSILTEGLFITYGGSEVDVPEIPRDITTYGAGTALSYVVMGDSTSISQGSTYKEGYAVASAEHLARRFKVSMVNTGISGATTQTVLEEQLEKAARYKPDVVLLAVGANDTTKFTSGDSIKESAQKIIDGLNKANPDVRIVVTRSPAMDSVHRFPFLSKPIMRLRTSQINAAYAEVIRANKNVTLAPVAEKTRDAFLKDTTLTAADYFHPNARGYALWKPVINEALDTALASRE